MPNSYSKSIKGKIIKWLYKSNLNLFCEKIKADVPCKVILINNKSNFTANPKSLLNMLNLRASEGDELEIVLISDSEEVLNKSLEKIKKIFEGFIEL